MGVGMRVGRWCWFLVGDWGGVLGYWDWWVVVVICF